MNFTKKEILTLLKLKYLFFLIVFLWTIQIFSFLLFDFFNIQQTFFTSAIIWSFTLILLFFIYIDIKKKLIEKEKTHALKENIEPNKETTQIRDSQLVKFKTAVEQSANSIIITDINGNIEYVNPRFSQLTGYSYKESIGLNPRILKTEKQPPEFYADLWKTILSGKVWKGELLNKKAQGGTYWEHVTITPIKNQKNEIVNFLAIKADITKRKTSEFKMKRMNEDLKFAEKEIRATHEELKTSTEALEQSYGKLKIAKEKAEESDKLKSAFLANMSHEIRTPLNGIIGFSDLLASNDVPKERKKQYKEIITSSGDQLIKIITAIIDISKIESGQISINKKIFNFNKMLEKLKSLNEINDVYRNKNLKLELITELPDKYVNLISDESRLIQIFENLINNAIKFSFEGTISVGYKHKIDFLECFVKDPGIGILEKDKKRIFEKFRQADGNLNREFGGSGIGLSISQGLIELLGGKIWLESEENKGSTFFFTIPYDIEL